MAEWFKAPVLKTGVPARVPWVRIPPLPPEAIEIANQLEISGLYAQSSVQGFSAETDTIGLIVLIVATAVVFIASKAQSHKGKELAHTEQGKYF